MKQKNLLIFGATGSCGRWAVDFALQKGYNVTALVRASSDVRMPNGVNIVHGDVMDANTVDKVMQGQDAVISCLGIRRRSASNPWSALISPPDFTEQSAKNIVGAMAKHHVERLVAISAAGVGDSYSQMNSVIKFMVRSSNIAKAYRDLENMEKVYENSSVSTLVLRPVTLVNGPPKGGVTTTDRYALSSKISRSDVASWMVDAINRPLSNKTQTEMITWG